MPSVPPDPRRWRPELIALCALAALTRFWGLSRPAAVVFDERPYETYISHYFSGTYYFNLHPPVGKLLLAFAAKLIGIAPETLAHPDPAVALRILPALAGALIVPVFSLLLRQLGAGRKVAFLGALLLLLDNALLTVSRFILVDSLLILFILGAVTAYMASGGRAGVWRWTLIAVSAVLAGLAVGTKWTGLAALAMMFGLWLRQCVTRRHAWPQRGMEALVLALVPFAVYVGAFAVHFALLPRSGPGDRMMSAAFQETLVGNPTYDTEARMSFGAKLADIHRAMRRGNDEYTGASHAAASPWWSWPVLKHPMYVWGGDALADGRTGRVLIVGNPVLWWLILIAVGAVAVAALANQRARARLAVHREALLLLLGGYAINYVPFAFIGRILFLYSYIPAMLFSLALAVVGVGSLAGWMEGDDTGAWRLPTRRSAALYWGGAGLALVAFLYFAPLSYGTPINEPAFQRRLWLLERHD